MLLRTSVKQMGFKTAVGKVLAHPVLPGQRQRMFRWDRAGGTGQAVQLAGATAFPGPELLLSHEWVGADG